MLKFAGFPDGIKGHGYTVTFAVSLCGPVNKFGNTVTLHVSQGLSILPRLQNRESFCNSKGNQSINQSINNFIYPRDHFTRKWSSKEP